MPPLSLVGENCVSVADRLEGFRGSWRLVLVGVESQRKFPEIVFFFVCVQKKVDLNDTCRLS